MVARGDLGGGSNRSCPDLPKENYSNGKRVRKTRYYWTHMLETMMNSPWPTRAEASDVANAILMEPML